MEGVHVASVTPFDAKGGLDLPSLEKHLNWLADAGVDGFVPCGTTGEGATLEADERRSVIALAVKVARERKLKTIAGAGHNNTKVAIQMVSEAAELGSDAVLVVTPYYNKPTQEGLVAHYTEIAKNSPLPIILYNVPGRTNVSISVETTLKLFELDKIVGIKEASGNHAQWLGIASRTDLNQKSLLSGDDDALATLMAMGGKGIISASANVAPKIFVDIYRAAKQGNYDEAFRLQKKCFRFVQSMFSETNPSPAKCALAAMGRMQETLRLPLVKVKESTRVEILSNLKALELY